MKRLFTLVLLSVIFTNFSLAQKKSVVDYFRLLPDSLNNGYVLTYKNKKWQTRNPLLEDPIYPIVDIRNGFIEIEDEGTGGGTLITQVVLYRKIDGSALIGVSLTEMDGVGIFGKLYFLELHNGKWEIVSDKVMPEIPVEMFMKQNYKVPNKVKNYLSFTYDLPRYGTSIKVKLQTGLFYTDNNDEDRKLFNEFNDNIARDSITLKWDKQNTRFVISEE